MKFGSWIVSRHGIYKEAALDIDTVPLYKLPRRVQYKLKGLNTYYELYKDHDLVRGMIDDLAESSCGQGIRTKVEQLSPKLGKNRSKDLCDSFNKYFNLDDVLPKVAKNMLIAGFCPVETKLSPSVDKCVLKVVHPKTIKEIETSPVDGGVLSAQQQVGRNKKTLKGENLAWFTYGNLANDPRGISFIHSIMQLLTTLDNAGTTVAKIAERYISPIAVWKSRMPSAQLKQKIQQREEGDAIFLGSQTPEEMKEDTVKFYQVDPRVPFWEYMENLELRVYAYSRSSNVWYTRNANLASSKTMEDIVARHVASIQRNIKRVMEAKWYAPLIQMNDYEEVPRVEFGKEPTGVEDITPADVINKGVDAGFINRLQFYDIMKQIGVKVNPELWEKSEISKENEKNGDKNEENPENTKKTVANEGEKE